MNRLSLRRLAGDLTRWWFVNYGCCGRCRRPWAIAKYHITDYSDGTGCFPLCESCWRELVPEQRLRYYRELVDQWSNYPGAKDYGITWELIRRAVLEGR